MNLCKGCGNAFRKGKTFLLLTEDGSLVPVIGCQDCVKRAARVVRPIGQAANLCTICKTVPARICSDCAVRARKALAAPILAQLSALARGADAAGQEERADGMRSAMRALEQEVERS